MLDFIRLWCRKDKCIDIIAKKDYSGVVTENNNSHERRIIMTQKTNRQNSLITENRSQVILMDDRR